MCKDCEECARFNISKDTGVTISGLEMCDDELEVSDIEQCPWPSKRKEKPNKYREAWNELDGYTFEDFERACRKVGLV